MSEKNGSDDFQRLCPVCLDSWKVKRVRAGWDNIIPYEIWYCGECGCEYRVAYKREVDCKTPLKT